MIGQLNALSILAEQSEAEQFEKKLDGCIETLCEIVEPGEDERDSSLMTSCQKEEAILNLVLALEKFHALLEIIEHCDFKTGDKHKVERLANLTTERISWALSVFSVLKPAN